MGRHTRRDLVHRSQIGLPSSHCEGFVRSDGDKEGRRKRALIRRSLQVWHPLLVIAMLKRMSFAPGRVHDAKGGVRGGRSARGICPDMGGGSIESEGDFRNVHLMSTMS